MKVGILGATGTVGCLIVAEALAAGHTVRAQGRSPERLAALEGAPECCPMQPTDAAALKTFCKGLDAVVFSLGVDTSARTMLFSDTTRGLIPAMHAAGARRLIAITGVGSGETRGHGGFLYDRIIFPLFTRHRYADKELQEKMIAQSGLEWVVIRPAPFATAAPAGALNVITEIRPDTRLTKVTRTEVARFTVEQLSNDSYLFQTPFIGHP